MVQAMVVLAIALMASRAMEACWHLHWEVKWMGLFEG